MSNNDINAGMIARWPTALGGKVIGAKAEGSNVLRRDKVKSVTRCAREGSVVRSDSISKEPA